MDARSRRPRTCGRVSGVVQADNLLRLTELAPHRAAVQTSAVVDVEDLLLSVDDEEYLLAVDLVVGADGLSHHREVDLGTAQKLDLLHREAIADAAALRNIGAAEAVAAC